MTRPALLLLALLAGCSSIQDAAQDRTRLTGNVPIGLGRLLEVAVTGADEATARDLVAAVQAEFEGRDLFDRVVAAAPDDGGAGRTAARLDVTVEGFSSQEVFDSWQIEYGYVVRYELDARLQAPGGDVVLAGKVSGIAVDSVTDTDLLDERRKDDMRVAALYDAASKLSRALRRAAEERSQAALEALPRITLPAGAGPVAIAVLGFDDEENAPRPRGRLLSEYLSEALEGLGPDVAVTTRDDVLRALDGELPRSLRGETHGVWALEGPRLAPVANKLSSRLFVGGRVVSSGGRVSAEARVVDRTGKVVFTAPPAAADGLGALRVVAVELARSIGDWLVASPPQ